MSAELPTLEQLAVFFDRYEPSALLGSQRPFTYLMIHKIAKRKVILHLMPKENAAEFGWNDDFMKKAKEAVTLQCPNFLKVEASGEMENHYYVVTEFSEDPAMEQMKTRLPLDPREALVAVKALAIGFREAHNRQIIHGRLDILNVHVNYRNFCKVCPLNLLPFRTVRAEREFYSPESLSAKGNYTVKDDIYSLGMIMYWLITGGVPSAKRNLMPSCLSSCSRQTDQLVSRAMNPLAGERYGSMNDLIKAIDDVVPHAEKEKKKGLAVPPPVVTVSRTASLTYFMLVPLLVLGIVMAWVGLQYKTEWAEMKKTWNDNEYKLHMERAQKEANKVRFEE